MSLVFIFNPKPLVNGISQGALFLAAFEAKLENVL
jgi:hypothetical protein